MGSDFKRSPVIRNYEDFVILACGFQVFVQRLHNSAVDVMRTSHLCFQISLVRALIRTLDMHIYHILSALVFFDCLGNLALIVCVDGSVGTLNIHNMHPRKNTDSPYEVDCGNHGCLHSEFFVEVRKFRTCSLSPDPKTVCRI